MRTLPVLLALTLTPLAHADIFKCVDTEGRITYTNSPASTRGCTQLQSDQPVSSIPAPSRPAAAAATSTSSSFPRVAPEAQRARDDTRRQVLEKELAAEESALTAAKAALTTEEGRDAPEDRNAPKKITKTVTGADGKAQTVTTLGPATLNLAKTEERLKPFRDKVELHQRNVEALRREIGGLR